MTASIPRRQRRGAFSCAALLALFTAAVATGATAPPSMRPPDGNLLLQGTVQSVTAGQRIIMTVTEVTLPDGELFELSPSRTKQVVISETTKVHVRGKTSATVQINDLQDVQKATFYMIAVGTDTGPGTDLAARDVSVWTGSADGKYSFQKP